MRKNTPKYKKIEKTLKRRLLTGGAGSELVLSESGIIAEFKVSATTARRVLDDLQAEGLVRRQVGRGTVAISPEQRRNQDFGVIFFDVFSSDDPHVGGIVEGIEELARRKGHSLHLFTTRKKPFSQDLDSPLRDLIARRKLAGIFVLSPIPVEDLRFMRGEGIPLVVVGNDYPGEAVSSVNFDYAGATREIGGRLIDDGLTRIAFSTTGVPLTGKVRRGRDLFREGYERLMNDKKLPFRDDFFVVSEERNDFGLKAMVDWHALPPVERPQAVLLGSINAVTGAKEFLKRHPDWRPLIIPPSENGEKLECGYRVSLQQMGGVAFKLLEQSLTNGAHSPRKELVPVSCVLPASQTQSTAR